MRKKLKGTIYELLRIEFLICRCESTINFRRPPCIYITNMNLVLTHSERTDCAANILRTQESFSICFFFVCNLHKKRSENGKTVILCAFIG